MATKIIEIPEDELRKIHSRLDVHKDVIETLISHLCLDIGGETGAELLEMLEESQNPFEVSDAVLHKE